MSTGGIEAYEVSHPFRETPWGEIRWAQEELNPHLQGRNLLFYPLNYEPNIN